MIYEIARFICSVILKTLFHFEITGQNIFPYHQPFILASNHVSNLDPVVLGVACPVPLYYLAKEELFKQKLFGHLLSAIHVIPVKRGKVDIQSVRIALKLLSVKPIVIFPQGTRAAPYDNFKAGVGFFQSKTHVPVFVAKISGTETILPKSATAPKPGNIRVSFTQLNNITADDSYEAVAFKVIEAIKNL